MAIVNNYNNTTSIKHGGVSYSSVYNNQVQYFPDGWTPPVASAYIEFEMYANSEWKIVINACNFCNISGTNIIVPFQNYNWNIYIDWWFVDNVYWNTWNINYANRHLLWNYTPWSLHTVKILPSNFEYWRAALWRFYDSALNHPDDCQLLKSIIHDSPYEWYWVSATNTWNGFRCWQFMWCTQLTTPVVEEIPNTVTTIWDDFRNWQYYWCTSLTSAAIEVLPNSVTSIWNYFRNSQYSWCTSIIQAADEVLSNSLTSVWYRFRDYQYAWCTSLTTTADEVFPDNISPNQIRRYQYQNCSSLSWIIKLKAVTGSSFSRQWQFSLSSGTHTPLIIKIYGNTVDTWRASAWLQDADVLEILVDSNLITGYQTASNWSAIDDSKFIALV